MDLANSMLKALGEGKLGNTPIHPEYLNMYFEKCLARDNLDGIAYLTNYCSKHNVNTSNWNLSSFRPALNYYLNVNYNAGKVMVFTKFYTNFYKDRKNYCFNQANEDLSEAASLIFGKYDDVIDLRSIFNYLIKQVGTKQIVDPLTKEDALWNLVEFFTKDPKFY